MAFAHPAVLYLLLLVPVLFAVKVWAEARSRHAVGCLTAPRLRAGLVTGSNAMARWVAFVLALAGFALVVLALARPQWGFTEDGRETEGRDILIALDTSRSMLAGDLSPSRLERARLVAQDLIGAHPTDRFGLLAFAGKAFLQAPVTIDHTAVIETLAQLDTETIPRGGTNLAEPLALAVETLAKSEGARHGLVLLSDGDHLEGTVVDAAREAAEAGLMVVAVGVGTPAGSVVPNPDYQSALPGSPPYITDQNGNPVRSRLERASLEQVAALTSGAYLTLGDSQQTQRRISDALRTLERSAVAAKDGRRPIERFQWPLLAGFVCIALAFLAPAVFSPTFRKAAAADFTPRAAPAATSMTSRSALSLVLLLAAAGLPAPLARAASDPEPLDRAADAAWRDYRAGRFEEALAHYAEAAALARTDAQRARLQFGLGSAAFRAGDLERATVAFSDALLARDPSLQGDAHYNLGNALFELGKQALEATRQAAAEAAEGPPPPAAYDDTLAAWHDALTHFDATLALDPKNEDAAFNHAAVSKWIESLKEQIAKEQQEQQGKDGKKGDEEGEGEGEGDPQDGEGKGKPSDDPNGKGREGEDGQGGDPREEETDGNGEKKDNPEPEGGGEGDDADPDLSGKLEAMDGTGKTGREAEDQGPADARVNPATGFSISEARQIIRTFADEDTLSRPPMRLPPEPVYKDW